MKTKLPEIYPEEWNEVFNNPFDYIPYRNLIHFKHSVSSIRQDDDENCGVTYKEALNDLMKGNSQFDDKTYNTIRNLVRLNLKKRGLLTEETYEAFRWGTDGTVIGVDPAKYVAGEPDCVMTPAVEYVDFFYELYINISYSHSHTDEDIAKNINKLLATIEELERQHIHIKITLVFSGSKVTPEKDFLSAIPLFSHKDFKSAKKMSSVLNSRLLRKFYFAILESTYGDELSYSKGYQLLLPHAMNIAEDFNEVDFFTEIQESAKQG